MKNAWWRKREKRGEKTSRDLNSSLWHSGSKGILEFITFTLWTLKAKRIHLCRIHFSRAKPIYACMVPCIIFLHAQTHKHTSFKNKIYNSPLSTNVCDWGMYGRIFVPKLWSFKTFKRAKTVHVEGLCMLLVQQSPVAPEKIACNTLVSLSVTALLLRPRVGLVI